MNPETFHDTKSGTARAIEPCDRADKEAAGRSCLSRRRLLLVGGAGAVTILLGELFPGRVAAEDERRRVRFAAYPRKKIGRLSQLVEHKPLEFLYPDDGPHSLSFLVRIGQPAGGGSVPSRMPWLSAHSVHIREEPCGISTTVNTRLLGPARCT